MLGRSRLAASTALNPKLHDELIVHKHGPRPQKIAGRRVLLPRTGSGFAPGFHDALIAVR